MAAFFGILLLRGVGDARAKGKEVTKGNIEDTGTVTRPVTTSTFIIKLSASSSTVQRFPQLGLSKRRPPSALCVTLVGCCGLAVGCFCLRLTAAPFLRPD